MISNLLMSKKSGFTLIELLVVIAIIAILSVVGVVVFKGVTTSARDAKRKADLNAISKAYEIKYTSTGFYQALADTDFAGGAIPKTPEGNNYPCLVGPDESNCTVQATDRIAYCVSLGDNQSAPCYANSSTCYCSSSTQGSSFLSGGSGEGGSNPSCDPYGILTSDLVGYWKMDEGRDNTVADSSDNNNINAWNDAVWLPLEGAENNCISGACLRFDGVNDHIAIQDSSSLTPLNAITVSLWVRARDCQPDSVYSGDAAHVIYKGESYGVYCYNRPGSKIRFSGWVRIGADSSRTYSGGNKDINKNEWANVLLIYDNQTLKLYVNEQSASAPVYKTGNIAVVAANLKISGNNGLPLRYRLNGDLDDIRIYNKALTPDEVELLYNGGDGCF